MEMGLESLKIVQTCIILAVFFSLSKSCRLRRDCSVGVLSNNSRTLLCKEMQKWLKAMRRLAGGEWLLWHTLDCASGKHVRLLYWTNDLLRYLAGLMLFTMKVAKSFLRFLMAISRGVSSLLFLASTNALYSTRQCATAVCPLIAAKCRAVFASDRLKEGLAPLSRSLFTKRVICAEKKLRHVAHILSHWRDHVHNHQRCFCGMLWVGDDEVQYGH